jgi:hypothetical protein
VTRPSTLGSSKIAIRSTVSRREECGRTVIDRPLRARGRGRAVAMGQRHIALSPAESQVIGVAMDPIRAAVRERSSDPGCAPLYTPRQQSERAWCSADILPDLMLDFETVTVAAGFSTSMPPPCWPCGSQVSYRRQAHRQGRQNNIPRCHIIDVAGGAELFVSFVVAKRSLSRVITTYRARSSSSRRQPVPYRGSLWQIDGGCALAIGWRRA